MKTILFIIQKEFIQIFRNKGMLPILFVMPFIQLVLLSFAADYEVKNIKLHIIDNDRSQASRLIISKFRANDHFELVGYGASAKQGFDELNAGTADLFVHIPLGFEKKLIQEKTSSIQITADAVNGVKAAISTGYVQNIIASYNKEFLKSLKRPAGMVALPVIDVAYSNWYNPQLNYKNFMVPGILVMLVTMIGAFLSGMNIVKEKEDGTIEQLNVTPIKKYQFIIGKLAPFWVIGMVILTIGLIIGKIIFNIPMVGSLFLVYGFTAIYLLLILGLGFFISTFTTTQQQALFLAWFVLVIFILMSGLMTPIESMPHWAQVLTKFNPVAWFVEFNRRVLLKGSTFPDVQDFFFYIAMAAVVMNVAAVVNYRKRV